MKNQVSDKVVIIRQRKFLSLITVPYFKEKQAKCMHIHCKKTIFSLNLHFFFSHLKITKRKKEAEGKKIQNFNILTKAKIHNIYSCIQKIQNILLLLS